jgi:hypothetical protein
MGSSAHRRHTRPRVLPRLPERWGGWLRWSCLCEETAIALSTTTGGRSAPPGECHESGSDDKRCVSTCCTCCAGGALTSTSTRPSPACPEMCGVRPAGLPHSPWRLLEHLRIAQWDILRFARPQHVSRRSPRATGPRATHRPTRCLGSQRRSLSCRPARDAELVQTRRRTCSRHCRTVRGRRSYASALVADHNAYHSASRRGPPARCLVRGILSPRSCLPRLSLPLGSDDAEGDVLGVRWPSA